MSPHPFSRIFLIMLLAGNLRLAGCAAVAGAAAGGIVGNEIGEDDGRFDPGEDIDKGLMTSKTPSTDTNPLLSLGPQIIHRGVVPCEV